MSTQVKVRYKSGQRREYIASRDVYNGESVTIEAPSQQRKGRVTVPLQLILELAKTVSLGRSQGRDPSLEVEHT